ncbi:hypothetical protein BHE74_00035195 [Ensete ventricosum]|nr:hypothetical protein BHE74_00035195 [Ensete ventricosum]RZS24534.1 hypothetical protein BHM03_00057613 [Ensete ventricosum]
MKEGRLEGKEQRLEQEDGVYIQIGGEEEWWWGETTERNGGKVAANTRGRSEGDGTKPSPRRRSTTIQSFRARVDLVLKPLCWGRVELVNGAPCRELGRRHDDRRYCSKDVDLQDEVVVLLCADDLKDTHIILFQVIIHHKVPPS